MEGSRRTPPVDYRSSLGSTERGGHKGRTSAWSRAGTLSVERSLTDSSLGSVEGSGRTPPEDYRSSLGSVAGSRRTPPGTRGADTVSGEESH